MPTKRNGTEANPQGINQSDLSYSSLAQRSAIKGMQRVIRRKLPDGSLILFADFASKYGLVDLDRFGIQRDKRTNPRHAPTIPMHAHEGSVEINFLAEGTQRYRIGETNYLFKPRTVYIVEPGLRHGSADFLKEKSLTYYLVIKTANGKNFLGYDTVTSKRLHKMICGIGTAVFPATQDIAGLFESLHRTCEKAAPHSDFHIRSLVTELILESARAAASPPQEPWSTLVNASLKKMREAEGPVNVKDLARSAGLSYSRFNHRFREETGESPRAHLLRFQIEKAETLLVKTSGNVTDIALACGFPSTNQFISQFKKFTGTTPGVFQKKFSKSR